MKQLLSFLLLIVISIGSYAKKNLYQPQAILVQLSTEQRKLDAIDKSGRENMAEQIKKDISRVQEVMKNDFSDNFSYCPVYYFYDTDLEQIKSYNFEGVLMDAKGNIVSKLKNGDTSHYIVYYGMSAPYDNNDGNKSYSLSSSKEALVLMDHHYEQLSVFKASKMFSAKNSKYDHESRYSTTISYKSYAAQLDKYLRNKID